MSVVEALIFDLDGVLVNTVDLHFRAWSHIAAAHDIPFSQSDMSRFRGRQRRECLLDLFQGRNLTEAEIAAYLQLKDQFYLDLLYQTAPESLLFPSVSEFIEGAYERHLKVGVASSSANAVPVLHYVGLFDCVQAVADGMMVAHSKPASDIFVWTSGALGVSPIRCIAFEDSHAGIIAARDAGMFTVAVGSEDLTDQAHFTMPDFDSMSLEAVLTVANQKLERHPYLMVR